ncbi:MFS transporter [Comamonas sp. GB3 AK4-5]|uniref:MFS transporter n=1 Tax=Comamonas sp. GB3 AK4-5 TaxID=3231487 RepID=UPI00351EA8E1
MENRISPHDDAQPPPGPSTGASAASRDVDVGELLDDGPFTAMQKWVVLLAAISIVIDGFDGQLIGFAIPFMIQEWGITKSAMAPAVALGLVGMGIGSACSGLLADHLGRRLAVITSVFVFGSATCFIGLAGDVWTLAALRFVAGLGIGGALPAATTVAAEFTPAHRRTLAVTATIVCVPLGGMLAGLFAAEVLPRLGWRWLFYIGGTFPLLLGLMLLAVLPESPRFLARYASRWEELRRLQARMGRPVDRAASFSNASEAQVGPHAGFHTLFQPLFVRDTVAVCLTFFMCLTAVYSAFSWLPTMLTTEGLSPGLATSGLTAYNLGGVIGALGCAVVIGRLGSRWPMVVCSVGAAVTVFAMLGINTATSPALLIWGFGIHGLFTNAVQSTMFAVCAFIYPTTVRARGTACGLVFGRLGAILSAFAGAAVITAYGAAGYLNLLGIAMLLAAVALLLVKHHIPRRVSKA